jgi:hypothetical protein
MKPSSGVVIPGQSIFDRLENFTIALQSRSSLSLCFGAFSATNRFILKRQSLFDTRNRSADDLASHTRPHPEVLEHFPNLRSTRELHDRAAIAKLSKSLFWRIFCDEPVSTSVRACSTHAIDQRTILPPIRDLILRC